MNFVAHGFGVARWRGRIALWRHRSRYIHTDPAVGSQTDMTRHRHSVTLLDKPYSWFVVIRRRSALMR